DNFMVLTPHIFSIKPDRFMELLVFYVFCIGH
ncbi:MAG: hypothetical protein ACI9IN_000478, partial [Porticoccaceae bacterium]